MTDTASPDRHIDAGERHNAVVESWLKAPELREILSQFRGTITGTAANHNHTAPRIKK